jgi:hypothetical protein
MVIFYLLLFSFVHPVYAQLPSVEAKKNVMAYDKAQNTLNSVLYQPFVPSIITEHEWKEFQLDRLITILDRTKTSFGRWGLKQLLQPIADSDELAQRKDIITFLIEHPIEFAFLQQQLSKIHDVEKSLLAYWDKSDAADKGAQQFYYSFPGTESLNDSSLALNGSVGTQMFTAWKGLLVALCLGGLQQEMTTWVMNEQKDFDIWRGILAGISDPLKYHNPYLSIFKDIATYDKDHKYTLKEYMRAMSLGSLGDKYKVLKAGYSVDVKVPTWFSSLFPARLTAFFANVAASPVKTEGIMGKISAAIGAIAPTIAYDYYWGSSLFAVGSHIVSMNQTLNQLYDRVVDVATCFNTIKSMNNVIKKHPEIADNHYTTIEYNAQANGCLNKLSAPRFAQKGSYLYSRGHVLSMHKEIKQVKKSLVPILQAVAFLDAYCSIVQLYQESQQQSVKFSFPEFVPSSKPLFAYDDAWLPLLPYKQAITNNLCLGDNCPGKIIITGPNGGGKSTILKTYGVAAILAQSWLIVPATHGSQSLFAEIKTGLAPHEDLEQGLSTFMAEKKRMLELFEAMQKSNAQKKNMLVLIDEPYKGTVDDESAKRIYQFGKDVAGFSHVLVAIATHVKKPVDLAIDTKGVFGNYQVKINEVSPGIFERLFKMEKGPAIWWFENADQRSRFIDWISTNPVVSN